MMGVYLWETIYTFLMGGPGGLQNILLYVQAVPSDPFYIVTYYIELGIGVTTSWTCSIVNFNHTFLSRGRCLKNFFKKDNPYCGGRGVIKLTLVPEAFPKPPRPG